MNYNDFNRLALNESPGLLSALVLLLNNGKEKIGAIDTKDIVASGMKYFADSVHEEKLSKIVSICKELATMDTVTLVSYIRRSSLDVSLPGDEASGICPVCGGELEYGENISMDDGGVYLWECPNCGATGKEGYNTVFEKHWDVKDKDGNPV